MSDAHQVLSFPVIIYHISMSPPSHLPVHCAPARSSLPQPYHPHSPYISRIWEYRQIRWIRHIFDIFDIFDEIVFIITSFDRSSDEILNSIINLFSKRLLGKDTENGDCHGWVNAGVIPPSHSDRVHLEASNQLQQTGRQLHIFTSCECQQVFPAGLNFWASSATLTKNPWVSLSELELAQHFMS